MLESSWIHTPFAAKNSVDRARLSQAPSPGSLSSPSPSSSAPPASSPSPSASFSASPSSPPSAFPRFLTYEWYHGCGGLGDTLLGLASTFVVALLDGRALVIRHRCLPFAFEPNLIDWRFPSTSASGSADRGSDDPGLTIPGSGNDTAADEAIDEIPLVPARKILTESVIAGSPETKEMGMDDVPMLDIRDTQFGSVQVGGACDCACLVVVATGWAWMTRLSWNRGVLTQMLTEEQSEWAARLRTTGLRPPYALGCILRFLLKPNAEVRQLLSGLEREVHAPGVVTIGVHIRFTDGTVWEGEGEDAPKQLGEAEVERLMQVARPLLSCTQHIAALTARVAAVAVASLIATAAAAPPLTLLSPPHPLRTGASLQAVEHWRFPPQLQVR
ncbi:unnamed protein product [Closterium sp. NIES-65]|nr:unnamed protein product [Closterium sp. NIES-65]